VHEIRAAFLAGETAHENLRRFRTERVARILTPETPAAMADGPKLIFHALPVSVDGEVWPRLLNLEEQAIVQALALIGGTTRDFRFNLDGYVVHTLRDEPSRQCYTQLFRSGGIEAVSGGVVTKDERRGGFSPQYMEEKVIGAMNSYKRFWSTLGVTPPLSVSLTLFGVKGWRALLGPAMPSRRRCSIGTSFRPPRSCCRTSPRHPMCSSDRSSTSCGTAQDTVTRRATATGDG
jgi:hypothetical protein